MAEDKGLDKEQRKELRDILEGLALSGGFDALIHQAILYDWSPQEFVVALTRSDSFRRQYPGVVSRDGQINDFLLGREGAPLSSTTLGQALTNYSQLRQSYEQAADRYGYGHINRNQMAVLIHNEVSPDEFGAKAYAINIVTKNKRTFEVYNKQRRAAGLDQLSRKEIFRAIATEDKKFYDAYEATRLNIMGLGLGVKGAQTVAGALANVNEQGQLTGVTPARTLAKLVADLKAQQADIGPELEQAGVSSLKLAKFLADPTRDPDLARKLEQVVATRRGTGAYVAGSQPRAGATGPRLGEDPPIASYG